MARHCRRLRRETIWTSPVTIIWTLVWIHLFLNHRDMKIIIFRWIAMNFSADPNKAVVSKKQTPDKGPVMLLYELFNDVQIDCISSDGVQHSRFKMVATVNNQKFEGTGSYFWCLIFCVLELFFNQLSFRSVEKAGKECSCQSSLSNVMWYFVQSNANEINRNRSNWKQ